MRTIAIINQKGGCGKTTTAINLSGMLAHRGRRVLLVDLDPQSHCAAGLGVPEQRIDLDIGDAMLAPPGRGLEAGRLLWRVGKNLDLIPSRMKLAGLEAVRGGLADKSDRDRRLAGVLQRLSPAYDIAIIDCSPSIGLLTFNALAAADVILIPVETSFFSLQGATKQYNTIQSLSRRLHHNAETWLLPTIHVPDSSMARDLLEEVHRRFAGHVVPGVVRRDPILAEAATFGQPVIEHAPQSDGAADYLTLADWLLDRMTQPGFAAAPTPASIDAAAILTGPTGMHPEHQAQQHAQDPGLADVIRGDSAGDDADSLLNPGLDDGDAFATTPASPTTRPGLARSRADDLAALALKMRREPQRSSAPAEFGSPTESAASIEFAAPAQEPATPEFLPPRQTVVVSADSRPGMTRPAASVQRLLGVRVTTQGALFVQPAALGQRVGIVGEFNGWSTDAHILQLNRELGVLELCIPLAAGVHRYQVIIDGRICPDPYNPDFEPAPSGGFHSLVRVGRE